MKLTKTKENLRKGERKTTPSSAENRLKSYSISICISLTTPTLTIQTIYFIIQLFRLAFFAIVNPSMRQSHPLNDSNWVFDEAQHLICYSQWFFSHSSCSISELSGERFWFFAPSKYFHHLILYNIDTNPYLNGMLYF